MKRKKQLTRSSTSGNSTKSNRSADPAEAHVLGNPEAPITLTEYGSYSSSSCHVAHEVIINLRDRFGDQMRYVYRHLPAPGDTQAYKAALLAECAAEKTDQFWEVHDALMNCQDLTDHHMKGIADAYNLPMPDTLNRQELTALEQRIEKDIQSGTESGALLAPTFYINGRKYEGPWDESSLAEAMVGTLGYRVHTASLDFLRWAPSAGIALLAMVVMALTLANSPWGSRFTAFWEIPFGIRAGKALFELPLIDWINNGLLSIFFLVVGLEIKREFTIGRLSNRRAGGLPVVAAVGGMVIPMIIYLAIAPAGPLSSGWGTVISTDTAFAIAIIAFMGNRVPVELRIFLTACAIVDDLASILVVAIFYTEDINSLYMLASIGLTAGLAGLNKWRVYSLLPYLILGCLLWFCLQNAGIHATLAGVILSLSIPTRPPANIRLLNAQAQRIIDSEARLYGERVMRNGPSQKAVEMLNTIHNRIESPARKVLHAVEPWSSYFVLPLFALANAGVVVTLDVFQTDLQLMAAIFFGLVIGKPLGIYTFSRMAIWLDIAEKPAAYNWWQLFGAGALAGIGFTMSLFIATEAFPIATDFAAAKIAIFIASIAAAGLGIVFLRKKQAELDD